jgi:hypothetical protein
LFLIETDGHRPNEGDSLLRKWILILIGRMWDSFPEAFLHAKRGDYIQNVIAFAKVNTLDQNYCSPDPLKIKSVKVF